MTLYYDTRIRPTVVKQWTAAGITNMDFSRSEIPEDEVDPKDSTLFKDTKIPLCFKNQVAKELYIAEEEAIKAEVRSKCARSSVRSVYNASEEDRLELVQNYRK